MGAKYARSQQASLSKHSHLLVHLREQRAERRKGGRVQRLLRGARGREQAAPRGRAASAAREARALEAVGWGGVVVVMLLVRAALLVKEAALGPRIGRVGDQRHTGRCTPPKRVLARAGQQA